VPDHCSARIILLLLSLCWWYWWWKWRQWGMVVAPVCMSVPMSVPVAMYGLKPNDDDACSRPVHLFASYPQREVSTHVRPMESPSQKRQVVLSLVVVVARAMLATRLESASHAGQPSVGNDTYATS
jgi:hypothetical protein